jgi:hypothetical protein
MIRKATLALAALAIAAPAQAEAPKVRALKEIYAAGFHDCADRMADFVAFLHEDDENYAYLGLWSQNKPNAETASVVTSQAYTDGHSIATVSAVKTLGGGCNVTLTQSFVVPDQTCAALKKSSFKAWKFYGELNKAEVLEDPTTANSNVVLTPIGKTGCMIVKHIVGFEP